MRAITRMVDSNHDRILVETDDGKPHIVGKPIQGKVHQITTWLNAGGLADILSLATPSRDGVNDAVDKEVELSQEEVGILKRLVQNLPQLPEDARPLFATEEGESLFGRMVEHAELLIDMTKQYKAMSEEDRKFVTVNQVEYDDFCKLFSEARERWAAEKVEKPAEFIDKKDLAKKIRLAAAWLDQEKPDWHAMLGNSGVSFSDTADYGEWFLSALEIKPYGVPDEHDDAVGLNNDFTEEMLRPFWLNEIAYRNFSPSLTPSPIHAHDHKPSRS